MTSSCYLVVIALVATAAGAAGQIAGALDGSFNPNVSGGSATVYETAVQADGKILVAGNFTTIGTTARNNIARLNADGTVDTTFDPGTGADGEVRGVVVQLDGKVVIAGGFVNVNAQPRSRIARLNADGSPESTTTFNPGTGPNSTVFALALQSDGKILLSGIFTLVNGQSRPHIARLNADGSVESTTTFNLGGGANNAVYGIAVQADGKILLGGDFTTVNSISRARIARLNPDGTLEGTATFNVGTGADFAVNTFALQPNGKILVGGVFTTMNGLPRAHMVRLGSDGAVEAATTFTADTDAQVQSIALQANGSIVIGGAFTYVSGQPRNHIARLLPDAMTILGWTTPNVESTSTFNSSANGVVYSIALQANGRILMGGTFTQPHNALARLVNDAASQSVTSSSSTRVQWARSGTTAEIEQVTFELSTNGGASWAALGVGTRITGGWERTGLNLPAQGAIRARGRATGGDFNGSSGVVEQLGPIGTGNVDAGFDPSITGGSGLTVLVIAVQADGKVIIAGTFTNVGPVDFFTGLGVTPRTNIARFNSDGSVDPDFNPAPNAQVTCVAVQPDGKILLGGNFTAVNGQPRNRIARLNPDGSLEATATFDPGTGANALIESIALQTDGKIVLGGNFSTLNGQARTRIARLNPDGTVESAATFNAGTGFDSLVYSVAVQFDGKIIVGGFFTSANGLARARIARLNADGSVEDTATFNSGTGANSTVYSVVPQADGKILMAGQFQAVNGQTRNRIARLNADGTVESTSTFNPGTGADGQVSSIALQTDGKIVLGGVFTAINGQTRGRVARLNVDGTVESTGSFDPGSGADFTVNAVALQADGRILLGGDFGNVSGIVRRKAARLSNDVATQTLTVPDRTQVQWQRGGSAPETAQASFDVTTDGTTWIRLGSGARVAGGWQLNGLTLPASGSIRADARATGGQSNGSSSIIEQVQMFSVPAPEIVVEQPAGTNIPDGGSKSFGVVNTGATTSLTFTIKNIGNLDLTGLTITKDGSDAAMFAVTANPIAPVSGPNGSTTFTVQFAPTSFGPKTAAIRIANNDFDENPFDINLTGTGTGPEIVVEQPAGTDVPDGGARSFGTLVLGTTASLTFTIKNIGDQNLTGLGITTDGANASDFSVIVAPGSPIVPGASAICTIRFAPTTSGAKAAAIHIASNDADENPFDITLTGQALSATEDTDGDGLNDAAEFQLAALGFDWRVSQPSLVNTYYSNANVAGLYTTSQVQALNVGVPLLTRNSATGQFRLTLALQKSSNLIQYIPFPFNAPQTTINGQGQIEFSFSVPDNAAFFRLEAR